MRRAEERYMESNVGNFVGDMFGEARDIES